MLLRFSASNHLSIEEPQAVSLVASSLKDTERGLIDCPAVDSGQVLPAAVIYGANASGKSNFIAAFDFMRVAVLYSHSRGEPGRGIQRRPFALDPMARDRPSTFEIDIVVEEVRYHYGFEADDKAFKSEWLHAFPHGRRQVLFERKGESFSFSRLLKGRNKIISELTRPNSLFLSAATQNDHEELSKISKFFRSNVAEEVPPFVISSELMDKEIDRRTIEFLGKIGTGIVDYRRRESKLPEKLIVFRKELAAIVQKLNQSGDPAQLVDDTKNVEVELGHRGRDGEPVFLALRFESEGTRRLLNLLGPVFRALDQGELLLIDELDASLHTQACEAVIGLFSLKSTNPHGAQLIATTHDTNLLRSPLLRRDQIWFTEKDDVGATHLYPLTDIRTRRGDNIEKGYLQGRFGAIPFSGSVTELVRDD